MNTLIIALFLGLAFAGTHEISLSEKISFKTGDIIKLKGSDYSVVIGGPYEPVKCAVPGRNCGAGYQPPRPTFDIKCSQTPCPYILMAFPEDGISGSLTIETEESCAKKGHQANTCFYDYGRQQESDEGCMKLKTALGRYHCLEMFHRSVRPENKKLCDQLPAEIYALRWNCYYEYAIRYKDPSFCSKYEAKDTKGADRCWLKMAELMKDKKYCSKISNSKEHSYREQCSEIKN